MICLLVNASDYVRDINIRYFTGYFPRFSVLAYDNETNKKCLFVIPFEKGMYKGIKNYAFNSKTFKQDLLSYFGRQNIRKIGINNKSLSLEWSERICKMLDLKSEVLKDISDSILKSRLIKSEQEIDNIQKAAKIGDKVFGKIVSKISNKELKTEKEIYNYIVSEGLNEGVEVSFEPVVSSGSNAAEPHHMSDNTKLSGFTIIDMGYLYKGYCSDMTRTIFVETSKVKITDKDIKNWEKVKEMHDYSRNLIKSNIKNAKVTKFGLIDSIVKANLGDEFTHSLGHGVGIEIHESPYLGSSSKDTLKEGMVFTIEPGIYKKNKYGIRHENLYAYKNKKIKKLTNSKEELIVVK